MTRIKIEEVVEHLDRDLARALEDAVREVVPEANFDRRRLFKTFVKKVRKRCNTWESIPDRYVEE